MAKASNLVFSNEEYMRRLKAVRQKMAQRGVDVVLVDQEQHLAYLTGFSTRQNFYQAGLFPLEGDPVMIVRNVDAPKFLEMSWVRNHTIVADWEDPVAEVVKTVEKNRWTDKCIGLELGSNYLTARRYEAIKEKLPRATLVDFSDELSELQFRKSPEEIEYIRKAAAIADAATLSAFGAAREGENERESLLAGFKTILEMGGDSDVIAFLNSGGRADVFHARLGNHVLEPGDVLFTEFMPQVKGYSARLMRCAVIGEPSRSQTETTQRLIEIQDEQIAAMRPGAIGKEVDRIAREGVLSSGLREKHEGNTGYALGYLGPTAWGDFTRFFLPTSEWSLEEGMAFHMYIYGNGLSISETVLVTADGPERLTKLERKLFVC